MNANKKHVMNGGWILCPSKTFPGKFYYFNVLNGEAAWSLGDAEKKIIKTIPKVQESHHHPEPTSPPTEPMIPQFNLRHPKPIFGQSVFPKALPKHEPHESVIWTPIQIQVPIVVPESRADQKQVPIVPERRADQKQVPIVPKSRANQIKQFPIVKQKTIWEFNNDLFIHACGKPLSQRFVNFENPVINFDKDNKIQNKLQFDKFYSTKNVVKTKTIASNDIFQFKGTSFSDLKPQKQLIKEAVFNIEVPSETPKVHKQIEPNVDCDMVDFGNIEQQNTFGDDLRNLLMAKKRKSVVKNSEEVESKKMKTTRFESTPKKKVSFNLDHEDMEFDDDEMDFREKYSPTIQVMRNLSGTSLDEWCIVVDAEVLLDEFSFLDKLVQLDPHCKLVIPSSALSYVRAASRGAHATAARSVLRRLDTPYIIVQSDDVSGNSPNDDVIKNCVDAMYRNIHVVLVSKDLELLAKAKCYPIHCYHIITIKNGLAPKPTEFKQNMKITIRNPQANSIGKGPAEDLKEKETLKCFKQKVNLITNECLNPTDISNANSWVCLENSKFSNKNSLFERCSRITKQNPLIAPNPSLNSVMNSYKTNLQGNLEMNPINSNKSNANSQDSNINAISLNHLFNTTKEVFNKVAKNDDNNENTMLTEWRYAPSDITETTIETDMRNLNLKEKYQGIDQTTHQKEKLNKNVSFFTHNSTSDLHRFNRTPMFQNSRGNVQNAHFKNFKTPVFQNDSENVQDSVQKSNNETLFQNGSKNVQDSNFKNFKTPVFQKDSENVQDPVQKSNFKTPKFQIGSEKVLNSNFEVQKWNFKMPNSQSRENVQDSVQKSNFKTSKFQNGSENVQNSNFEVQKWNFKIPNSQSREIVQDSVQKSNFKTLFQNGSENVQNSNFEVQKWNFKMPNIRNGRENGQDSNFETQSNYRTPTFQNASENVQNSNFEIQNVQTPLFQNARKNEQNSIFEIQNVQMPKFQNGSENVQDSVQKSNFKTPKFQNGSEHVQNSNFEVQKSNFKTPIFQNGRGDVQNFEVQKSKEPLFENRESETDVYKKPNKPLNWTKRSTTIDLSNFYVKSKVMDSRLRERMDEFLCTYKQIMEEFLSSILEKLYPTVLKCMAPPWSLYEALQCAKNVYKDHLMVKNIVDQLSGFLYETNCKKDVMKIVITPGEFMKAIGCGVHLIQYLKKILQPSTEILDSEQHLMNMVRQIEDPVNDVIEPLVKTPVDNNTDYKEIRHNFVKNPTDIISYLKKHYPEWQSYEDMNKMKIVRTFGRNLNKLKLERVKEIEKKTGNDKDEDINDVVMKNDDVATINTDVMKNVEGIKNVGNQNDGKVTLERTKIPNFKDTTPKNVGLYLMKEVDKITANVDEEGVKLVQEMKTKDKQNDHNTNLDNSRNAGKIENAKPKTKSIFDFVIPKDNSNENQKEKFHIDSKTLGVKITIPNNKEVLHKNVCRDSDANRFENKSLNKKCVRKLNMDPKEDYKNKEINKNDNTDKEKAQGIKIIRNIHLIEEFENRLKKKEILDFYNLDCSTISSDDDDDVLHTNVCNTNNDQIIDHDQTRDNNIDHTKDLNVCNKLNGQKNQNLDNKREHYKDKNYYSNDKIIEKQKGSKENCIQNIDNCKNYVKDHKIHEDDPKNGVDDPKNDLNERKSEKDDTTNDSGFGNESPRVYSVVKSLSFELESSLELMRTYIDGSLQEFRDGKLTEATKKTLRLKAFEANFVTTRIISRLNRLTQEVSTGKIISKNAEVMSKCLERAEVLQKALNMIISVTNESSLVELNSSMSLNLSS